MSPSTPADKLADVEERLLDVGHRMTFREQLVEARRRITWSRQWIRFARISATDVAALLDETDRHLRAALDLADREVSE